MKKTVLFLIFVVCIVSVFVVTIFGMQASIDQFKVYIEQVEITSFDNPETYQSVGKRINLVYNEEEGSSTFIDYKIGPTTATNKSNIRFSIDDVDVEVDSQGKNWCYKKLDGERVLVATIDQKGEIYFYRRGTVYVILSSTDGIPAKDTVRVKCS